MGILTKSSLNHQPQVLLVEDEFILTLDYETQLTEYGCVVEVAKNGAEAIALLQEKAEHITHIITDVRMPKSDGIAVLEFVAQQTRQPRCYVHSSDSNYHHNGRGYDLREIPVRFPFACFHSKLDFPVEVRSFLTTENP